MGNTPAIYFCLLSLILFGVILIMIGLTRQEESTENNYPLVRSEYNRRTGTSNYTPMKVNNPVVTKTENLPDELTSYIKLMEKKYRTNDGLKIVRSLEKYSRGETTRREGPDLEAEIENHHYERDWQITRVRGKKN